MSESDDRPLWDTRPRPSRRHQTPATDPNNLITQEELSELIRLQRQRNCYQRCWDSIRQRLLEGAEVEPGRHRVRIEEREVIRFSQSSLRLLLGKEWVEALRAQIPPVCQKKMVLQEGGIRNHVGE